MDEYQVDVDACRGRQSRLIDYMRRQDLAMAIVRTAENIIWLTGARFGWVFEAAAVLRVDGELTLVAPRPTTDPIAADNVLTYEAKWHSTLRNDQPHACHAVIQKALHSELSDSRVGVEFSRFGHYTSIDPANLVDLEPAFYQLRRRKDADEIALIKKAIAGTERMYSVARQIIAPGIAELEVFNQLQSAAVEEFGEMMTQTGNDYRCGERGGPPRDGRKAVSGELYILDLGPAFRGYFADNARTIAVADPTDVQREAWRYVIRALEHVEASVRPGVSAKQLFEDVSELLREAPVGEFNHHLGHGIGLFPHEAPHLNPNWDDTFEEGDVFTAEPGLYAPELKAGLRIENDFLVTGDGVELLTDFDLTL
jgi:Xaa-Pro aminopeptidase